MVKLREREAESNKKMQEKLINNNIDRARVEKKELQYKAFLRLREKLEHVVIIPIDMHRTRKNELFKRVKGRRYVYKEF